MRTTFLAPDCGIDHGDDRGDERRGEADRDDGDADDAGGQS
jgi:hypothetical protein